VRRWAPSDDEKSGRKDDPLHLGPVSSKNNLLVPEILLYSILLNVVFIFRNFICISNLPHYKSTIIN